MDQTISSWQRTKEWLGNYCWFFLLLALTAVFFRKGLFSSSPVVFANNILLDLTHQFYPWRFFGYHMLKRGVFPLWNPYLFCGYPLMANWSLAIFYPPNLIFLLMPTHTALNYTFALHIFLAGMFTYFFMHYVSRTRFAPLVASLTYMFSAPLMLRIFAGHLTIVCAVPWFPAQLLAVEAGIRTGRLRYYIFGGIALSMQLLAGHPQYPFYSLIGVFLYFLFRLPSAVGHDKRLRSVIAACICFAILVTAGLCLSGVQILPSVEYTRYSQRGQELSFSEAAVNSIPPENLLNFLMPSAFGDFSHVFHWGRCLLWEGSVYIGILPLALVLLALLCARGRPVYIFSAIALISFAFSLGRYTPLLKILYDFVPGFKLVRASGRMFFITAFFLCCLSGFGAEALVDPIRKRSKCFIAVFCLILLSSLAVLVLYAADVDQTEGQSTLWNSLLHYRKTIDRNYWPQLNNPLFVTNAFYMFKMDFVRLLTFLGVTVLTLLFAIVRRGGSMLAKLLVTLVVMVDLWSYDAPFITTLPVSSCWWPKSVVDFFDKDSSMFRYLRDTRVREVGVNQNMNNGFYSASGYEPDCVAVYRQFIDSMGVTTEKTVRAIEDRDRTKIIAMMNLKYFILPLKPIILLPWCVPKMDGTDFRIYENMKLLPRAYLVHGAKVIGDPVETLGYMKGDDFQPSEQVVLDEAPEHPLPEHGAALEAEETTILNYTPNEVVIQCNLEERGILFLSDTYYPSWVVTVDGMPGRILRANYAFRGVPMERGSHNVRFRYDAVSLRRGAALSLLTVIVLAAYLLFGPKTRRG